MPVSFVLRLVPSALAEARIVGQVQEVETGLTVQLRNADELIAFLVNRSHDEGPDQSGALGAQFGVLPAGDGE
jgi:hypothetical protein